MIRLAMLLLALQSQPAAQSNVTSSQSAAPQRSAASTQPAADVRHARGALLLVGGGGTTQEIVDAALRLAGGADKARVLIIPHASSAPDAGQSSEQFWREHGSKIVSVLDLSDRTTAREAIARADFIWMPGGVQSRLVDALREADMIEPIRERFIAGAVVGGTSAGCAAATGTMILRDGEGPSLRGGATPTGPGLGLWPEAIVDQHFVKRGRLERLITAVLDQPRLLGVGVDEQTAVIVRETSIEALGAGQVVIVDARKAKAESKPGEMQTARDVRVSILKAGERTER